MRLSLVHAPGGNRNLSSQVARPGAGVHQRGPAAQAARRKLGAKYVHVGDPGQGLET
jgi:hypothetical protein